MPPTKKIVKQIKELGFVFHHEDKKHSVYKHKTITPPYEGHTYCLARGTDKFWASYIKSLTKIVSNSLEQMKADNENDN